MQFPNRKLLNENTCIRYHTALRYHVVKTLVLSRYLAEGCANGLSQIPLCGIQSSGLYHCRQSKKSACVEREACGALMPVAYSFEFIIPNRVYRS